jgi:outer membrane biosynthesis protein TonB
MEAYAIPVAHRSIVAIAKAIKAKPPQSEPNALKELSPSVDSFNYTNEQFIEANRQVWEWELAEKWEETESIQIPNPEPTPQPIPDNVAIAEPAPKPKAKSKQSPKPKGIATLIITEASK